MLSDANKIAWATADADPKGRFLAALAPTQYDGSSSEGTILGEPLCDRVVIPHAPFEVIQSPDRLKSKFLADLALLSRNAQSNDTLFVVVCSHGRQSDGAILVGGVDDPNHRVYISIADVQKALRLKPKSRSLALPPFTHASLARLRVVPHQAGQTPDPSYSHISTAPTLELSARISGLSLDPALSERLLTLAAALPGYNLPTTRTVNHLSRWIRLLGTENPAPRVDTSVILHALGYQEHLLLLADAMWLTGAWSRNITAPADVDLSAVLKTRSTVSTRDLLPILGTDHRYTRPSDQESWDFDWNAPVVDQFLTGWYRAGCPEIEIAQIRRARTEVEAWLRCLGKEEPKLCCPCGDHLLVTQAEYEARFSDYIERERKEYILRTSFVMDSPHTPGGSASSFSFYDLFTIVHRGVTPTFP
ncbi:hypothetical protein B0H17DRAFT_1180334 [Mycena rosella]|uniref:Uncharacterized protein n=1 Tax=Mycena rosella TaxID=1033263 RepID=A0AAD7DDL1_MYCRO|nr:hypothetical protein B0H17DRAFT_1180334 [Mycena rosella]